MKILYVTGLPIPLKDLLTGKKEDEITGLPGFYYPWKYLVKRGHKVDFVFISNFKEKYNIVVDWFNEKNILANIYAPYKEYRFMRFVRQIFRLIQLFYYTLKAVKAKKYDFIYCKSYEGFAGQLVSKIYKIPSGIRLFGDFTFCYNDIKKFGNFKAIMKHPLEYLSFKVGANFLLSTDDGSNCDDLFKIWGNKKTKFYFWKTGIDLNLPKDEKINIKLPEKFLYYPARYVDWKRQDRALKILKLLFDKNIKNLYLIFTGNLTSVEHYNNLHKIAEEYGIENNVIFEKEVSQNQMRLISQKSLANILVADHSNLGNVFYEILSSGSVIISFKNRGVDDLIVDGYNGFLMEDEEGFAENIKKIIDGKIDIKKIKENARKTALERFLSLEERFLKEVELIEKTARKNNKYED